MKVAITTGLVVLIALAFAGPARAHDGKEQHIMGTVQKVSDDSLVIETTKQEMVTVTLSSETKYVRSGEPATLKDLKRGERVAIDADVHGGHPIAKMVRFGAPQKMRH